MDTALPSLTARQAECLNGKWHRKLDKEIAYELGISQRAVEEHLRVAREKLGVSSTRAAVALAAARYGWEGSAEPNRGLTDLPEPLFPGADAAPAEPGMVYDSAVRDGGAIVAPAMPERLKLASLPFALHGESRNAMDLSMRLIWPVVIATLVPAILVLTLMMSDYAGRLVDNIIRLLR